MAAKFRSAKPQVTASALAPERSAPASARSRRRIAARPRPGEHARREVDADRARARLGRERRQVPGAAGEVDHHVAGAERRRRDRRAPPAAVEPEGQHRVQAVVARRDAVEHRPHRRRLLGRTGEGPYRHVTSSRPAVAAASACLSARSSPAARDGRARATSVR
jgi:hypothetical protein